VVQRDGAVPVYGGGQAHAHCNIRSSRHDKRL
jgi:hypothetical protein